jgi:hypothetical protein
MAVKQRHTDKTKMYQPVGDPFAEGSRRLRFPRHQKVCPASPVSLPSPKKKICHNPKQTQLLQPFGKRFQNLVLLFAASEHKEM